MPCSSLRSPQRWRSLLIAALACVAAVVTADAGARTETVRWQQEDWTGVAGFNLYVGTTSGSYGPRIDVGMATAEGGIFAYDLEIADGLGVYVIATAYSRSGQESAPSNELLLAGCELDFDCDDADACTGVEQCHSGSCAVGTPPDCSVSDPCATGTCDSQLGCVSEPAPDGAVCDDGDPATVLDTCQAGVCVGALAAPPPECSIDDDCTGDQVCYEGTCGEPVVTGTPCASHAECQIPGKCQLGICHPTLGCLIDFAPDGTTCDDGNPTTLVDVCIAAECVGDPPPPEPRQTVEADPGRAIPLLPILLDYLDLLD